MSRRRLRLAAPLLSALLFIGLASASGDEPAEKTRPLVDGTTLVYAGQEQAAEFLGEEDEYTQSLSGIDRRIRMQATEDPGDEAFRKHAAEAARDWSADERAKLNAAWDQVAGPLKDLRAKLPQEILMIRTTGDEESNAAYTRRNAIVLPEKALERDPNKLAKLLAHELFHVLSRSQPSVRWDLYRIVGFEPAELTDVPESLASRKITNPDAPLWNTRIQIGKPGEEVHGVPILLARVRDGKVETNGSLFEVMEFKLLLVEKSGDAWKPMRSDERPLLVDPRSVPTFAEKIGRNTPYIIHPDEILAENFVHAIFDTPDLPDREIVEQLDQILFRP
ncbi:MAG TPA: hypothetical protein VGN57_07670 [Pirellulaceae bacterium]|nr:hypothetical protein [Pirellulaceae bacterium]